MSKDRHRNKRSVKAGELMKRKQRKAARKEAWKRTTNGAGPRDISDPHRHHR